jgi:hypothetical protein
MPSTTPPVTPQQSPRKHTTRSDRIRIKALHEVGFTYREIHLARRQYTPRMIEYAINQPNTPSKHGKRGRKPYLTEEQTDWLVAYVHSGKAQRQMPLEQLAMFFGTHVGVKAIRAALKRRGHKRYVRLRKPPLNDTYRATRLI